MKKSMLVLALTATTTVVILFFLQQNDQQHGAGEVSHTEMLQPSLSSPLKSKGFAINSGSNSNHKYIPGFDQGPVDVNQEDSGGDNIKESLDESEIEPYFPATIVGELLTENMALTEGIGPDAENNYQKSLEQLRLSPKETVTLLADAYKKIEEKKYLDRWKIVDTLAAITTDYSLKTLSAIAHSDVPEEKFPGAHGMSSKSEEMIIRRAAIQGIENLASNGNPKAEEILLSLTRAKEKNVREGAVLAYIRTGSSTEARKAELKQTLPEKDHWMLELKQLSDPVLEIDANGEPIKGIDTHTGILDPPDLKLEMVSSYNTAPIYTKLKE